MSDDLVQRVAFAVCVDAGTNHVCKIACIDCRKEARAAIAVCMEEAAKVAGKWQQMYFEDEKVHSSNITEYIVADIRALAKEPA